MKRYHILLLLLFTLVNVVAQDLRKFSVVSFEEKPFDLTATDERYKIVDGNGALFSIIKLVSATPDDDLTAYSFDFGLCEDREKTINGERWIYVQRNAMHATIKREGFQPVKYELNLTVQEGKVYEMVLQAAPQGYPKTVSSSQESIGGYEYVDLGLPSGLKWATCNVGANTPEEYGDYYAWGEVETKSEYSWDTYKWCEGYYSTMTKYCTCCSYGKVDNKTVLEPEDDVVHVKWGGSWRMPTKAEILELREKCTWKWTTQNGVNGYRVTGPNGNSIFLPAAGYRNGAGFNYRHYYGFYWSSSLSDIYDYNAYYWFLHVSNYRLLYNCRFCGLSVRPVTE